MVMSRLVFLPSMEKKVELEMVARLVFLPSMEVKVELKTFVLLILVVWTAFSKINRKSYK